MEGLVSLKSCDWRGSSSVLYIPTHRPLRASLTPDLYFKIKKQPIFYVLWTLLSKVSQLLLNLSRRRHFYPMNKWLSLHRLVQTIYFPDTPLLMDGVCLRCWGRRPGYVSTWLRFPLLHISLKCLSQSTTSSFVISRQISKLTAPFFCLSVILWSSSLFWLMCLFLWSINWQNFPRGVTVMFVFLVLPNQQLLTLIKQLNLRNLRL